MDLIEKYLGEAIKITNIPKNIMGMAVKLEKQEKSNNGILYQLYIEKKATKGGKLEKQKSGVVRQYDIDAEESIETRKFPNFNNAKKYYEKLIKLK